MSVHISYARDEWWLFFDWAQKIPTSRTRTILTGMLNCSPDDLQKMNTGLSQTKLEMQLAELEDNERVAKKTIQFISTAKDFVTSGGVSAVASVALWLAGQVRAKQGGKKGLPLLLDLKMDEMQDLYNKFYSADFQEQLFRASVLFCRPGQSEHDAMTWSTAFFERVHLIVRRFDWFKEAVLRIDFSKRDYNKDDAIYEAAPGLIAIMDAQWSYLVTEIQILQTDLTPRDANMNIPHAWRVEYGTLKQMYARLFDHEYAWLETFLKWAPLIRELTKLKVTLRAAETDPILRGKIESAQNLSRAVIEGSANLHTERANIRISLPNYPLYSSIRETNLIDM